MRAPVHSAIGDRLEIFPPQQITVHRPEQERSKRPHDQIKQQRHSVHGDKDTEEIHRSDKTLIKAGRRGGRQSGIVAILDRVCDRIIGPDSEHGDPDGAGEVDAASLVEVGR